MPRNQPVRADARLVTALDVVPDALDIATAVRDESGRIVDFRIEFVNRAAGGLDGLEPADVEGRSVREIWPDARENGWFDALVAVVESGESGATPVGRLLGDASGRHLDVQAARLEDGYVCLWREAPEPKPRASSARRHKPRGRAVRYAKKRDRAEIL